MGRILGKAQMGNLNHEASAGGQDWRNHSQGLSIYTPGTSVLLGISLSLSLSPHCISTLAWSLRVDPNLTRLLASMKETYEAARTAKGYAQEISTESLVPYLFVKVVQKMPRFKLVEE